MDWIEQLFGWSPDNGDGSFEMFLMLLSATAVVAATLVFSRPARAAFMRMVHVVLPGSPRKP
jgi:hypothetical protein